jgi:hypothetical protein
METETIASPVRRGRGRPARADGIPPSQFRHDLLLDKFNSDRTVNVRLLCEVIHINRMHFYRVIKGKTPATRETIEAIARYLGITQPIVT